MVDTESKDLRGVVVRVQPEGDDVLPEASDEFVATPHIQALAERALAYLEVGYAVHFAGAAGTGKTTLAFHVAAKLGHPVTLIHGDDEFGSSDLTGKDSGYRKSKLIDNYIHSVLKTEESMNTLWVDNRLTTACANGNTLIYDEFNRSRPEANNALLSVLEERILNLPALRPSGAVPRSAPELPGDFHIEPGGVCRGSQDPRRSDGPADHAQPGQLRSRDGDPDWDG